MKRNFKGIALVALLAVAGLFGATTALIANKVLPTDNNEVIEAEATGALYETVGTTEYRVIYFYVDSNWAYDNEFGNNAQSDSKTYRYVYKVGENSPVTVLFDQAYPTQSGDSFYQIISDFTAKIYLPAKVSEIYFRCSSSSGDKYQTVTYDLINDYPDGQCLTITTDQSSKQTGVWETYDVFMARFTTIYFTIKSEWFSGESNIGNCYVWVTHTGSDSVSIGRDFPIVSTTMVKTWETNKHYAKVLVSSVSDAKVCFTKGHNNWGNSASNEYAIDTDGRTLYYVYTNVDDWWSTRQSCYTADMLFEDDYIYFTPSLNWAGNSAGFKIVTQDIFEGDIETYETMTLLTNTKFNGMFTTDTVYYYQLTKVCCITKFMRWNPAHMDSKDPSVGQWNYSGACYHVNSSYYWVDMGTSSWYDTWTTSDSSGVVWQACGDLLSKTSDQSPSDNTGRIIFNNSGSAWAGDGKCAVRAWGGKSSSYGFTATCYVLNWFHDKDSADTGVWYGYADIPLDVTGYQFVLLSDEDYGASIWNYQTGDNFSKSTSSFSQVYYASGNEKTNITISTGAAKDSKAYTSLMAVVLAAVNTCSDSEYNGYNAYTNLNNNFYSKATSTAQYSVCSSLNSIESYSVSTHFAALAARSTAQSPVNLYGIQIGLLSKIDTAETSVTTIVIIIASAISLISITVLSILLVKKRKIKGTN